MVHAKCTVTQSFTPESRVDSRWHSTAKSPPVPSDPFTKFTITKLFTWPCRHSPHTSLLSASHGHRTISLSLSLSLFNHRHPHRHGHSHCLPHLSPSATYSLARPRVPLSRYVADGPLSLQMSTDR